MTNRPNLIKELEALLDGSLDYSLNLINYQKLKENDARVTFFKHINVVLDSATTSLILAHKYLGEMGWWNDLQKEYNRSTKRPYPFNRQFGYFDQTVMNGYFLFIFNSFEHSVRLIYRQYNPQSYEKQKTSINSLSNGITKNLGLAKRVDFIDLITLLRNSFHNNGTFNPGGKQHNRKIPWNNTIYYFNENKPINESKGDMWLTFYVLFVDFQEFQVFVHTFQKSFTYSPAGFKHLYLYTKLQLSNRASK